MPAENPRAQRGGVSRGPEGRRGRGLPRHQGRRPLSPARRPRRRRDAGLDRGREQNHVRLSRSDPRPPAAESAAHPALEFRKVFGPVHRRRPILLQSQQRPAEPERGLHGPVPRRHAPDLARPQFALGRRHGCAGANGRQRRWQADGLRAGRRGLRLDHLEGPRRRDGQGPRRFDQVEQILNRLVDQG